MSNELSAQDLLPPEIGLTLLGFDKSEQGWLVSAEGRTGSECPACGMKSTLLPFGKVANFLGELLPLSARATAGTVRNRTMVPSHLLLLHHYARSLYCGAMLKPREANPEYDAIKQTLSRN